MKSATGELIAVFDADFVPPSDFLMRTVHYFADPKIGVVQTRWSYLNRHYSVLTEVEAMLLDGHFVIEHAARFGSGLFFNFNGTAGVLRARMIEDAGGWQHDTLTEDTDLSYRAQLKGWRFLYVPSIDCPSELPVDTYGFQVQQSRWAKGLTQVAKKLLPTILRSDLPRRVKLEAFFHLTPNISYPLMLSRFGADVAGDDRAVLHGLVSDADHRPAADHGFVLVDFGVLFDGATPALSQELEAYSGADAGADGGGRGAHGDQYEGGSGGAVWHQVRLRAHGQIRHRR